MYGRVGDVPSQAESHWTAGLVVARSLSNDNKSEWFTCKYPVGRIRHGLLTFLEERMLIWAFCFRFLFSIFF